MYPHTLEELQSAYNSLKNENKTLKELNQLLQDGQGELELKSQKNNDIVEKLRIRLTHAKRVVRDMKHARIHYACYGLVVAELEEILNETTPEES